MTKLEELRKQIDECKEAYYNGGKSPLDDVQYDALVAKAERLGYIDYVGSKPSKEIPTIKHNHLMLSLDKCHSVTEIKKFTEPTKGRDVVFMWKADGLTCSATYIDGILARLETRGNGEVGNDIMLHANSIKNLPKIIEKPGRYVIDGEVIILQRDFDRVNINGEYSNPRNLASGSLNQLDPAVSAQRGLKFFAWDVIEGGSSDLLGRNLMEAEGLGFSIVKMVVGDDTVINIDRTLERMKAEAEEVGFPIDGVVIKFDSKSFGETLGRTDKFFKNALAYKYKDESHETRLDHIEWQLGKSSQITPVAVFDPIEIDSTIVNKASLHNLSIIKALGLTNHCTVHVTKCNCIIPQIVECDDNGDGPIEVPSTCPVCNSPTRVTKINNSEVLYCSNLECKGRVISQLNHFVSKKAMDIDGLSEKTLEVLYNMGVVQKFADIYSLREHKDVLEQVPGFGKKSVTKLLDSIDSSRQNVQLANFICALSIPNIGTSQSRVLANVFGTWDDFYKAAFSYYDFDRLEGFGKVLKDSILNWFDDYGDEANELAKLMAFAGVEEEKPSETSLSGKTFVITGKLQTYPNRDALVAVITTHGGKVASSVSKNTDYLINNNKTSTSSKNLKALQIGVKIITESDFSKMI